MSLLVYVLCDCACSFIQLYNTCLMLLLPPSSSCDDIIILPLPSSSSLLPPSFILLPSFLLLPPSFPQDPSCSTIRSQVNHPLLSAVLMLLWLLPYAFALALLFNVSGIIKRLYTSVSSMCNRRINHYHDLKATQRRARYVTNFSLCVGFSRVIH